MFLEISQNSQNTYARLSFLIKTLLKKRLWYWYFPVNFARLLRPPSSQNTFGRLLFYLSEYLIDFQGNFKLNLSKEGDLFKGWSFTLWVCSLFGNYIPFQKKNFRQFLIPALGILDMYIGVKKSHCCAALVTVRFPETRNTNIMKCKINVLKHHF